MTTHPTTAPPGARPRRRLRAAVVPAVVAVLAASFLVACSSGSGSGPNPSAPATFKAEAVNNPHPVADLKQGGNLNFPISQWVANWNYNQIDGTTVDMGQMRMALFPQPFKAAPDGSLSVDTKWFTDVAVSDKAGKQVVTYTIDPRAKWSTGRALDWTDLEAQWKALNGKNSAYEASSTAGYEDVESVVRGVNDQQAVVTFAKKFGEYQGVFSPLYAKEVNATPESFNTGYKTTPPPTAGPFKVKSADGTSKRIVVERDPAWWGEKPVLDTITFIALDSTATTGAMQNGEIDLNDLTTIDDFKVARGLSGVDIRQSLGYQWRHFDFNGAKGRITEDQAVRVAIMRGINRDLIAKALMGPVTSSPTVLNSHMFVEGQKGYEANNGDITYDPEKAKAELDAAGWKLEGEFRKKNGKQLDLRDVLPADTPNALQEAQLIQQALKAIGVNLIIDTVPTDDFFEKYVLVGQFDVTQFTWEGTPTNISSAAGIYQLNPKNTGQNYGQIGNDEINKLYADAMAETDPVKRGELANEADKAIFKLGHSLPLYQRPYSIAAKAKLANIGAPALGDWDFINVGWLP